MKIRFFNTYEPVSSFYRDLIPHLVAHGEATEIVVSKAEYRKGRDLESAIGHHPNVRLVRTVNLGAHAHQGMAAKALVTALYTLHASLHALLGSNVDLNVFLSQPPLIPLLGLMLARLRRQPYYCVVMDVQPQMAVALGLARSDALSTKILGRLSVLALQGARGVFVIGRCMAERVAAAGVDSRKIHVVVNWANEDVIQPISPERNPVRADLGWKDNFVLLYAGNIGLPQHFDDLLDVAERLQKADGYQNIQIALIGGGARERQLRAQVQSRQLKNVEIHPFLHEHHSLSDILSAGDVHLVTLRNECTGLAVPSKAYGIMASGRPIIYQGGEDGEIARMLVEEEIGQWVSVGDVDGLLAAILSYATDKGLRQRHGERARQLTEGKYSREAVLERYRCILLGVQEDSGDSQVMRDGRGFLAS